jgi:hypothetical protein
MKRKKAICIFGVMAALVVGYIAWAARIFYVHPDAISDRYVTPEARKVVAIWMDAHPDFFLFPFDLDRLAGELCDPYRESLPLVSVTLCQRRYSPPSYPPELLVRRKGHRNVIRFWLSNGTWKGPTLH